MLAEESGESGSADSPYVWIVDPVDGTRNYAIGVPYFATTIALARDGEVVYGATYDPSRDEMFEARRGGGATCNGEPVRVSERTSLSMATLATDMGYNDAMAGFALQLLDRLWPGMQAVRIMGSAALGLAYTASGRADVYFHHCLAPWDIAAGHPARSGGRGGGHRPQRGADLAGQPLHHRRQRGPQGRVPPGHQGPALARSARRLAAGASPPSQHLVGPHLVPDVGLAVGHGLERRAPIE